MHPCQSVSLASSQRILPPLCFQLTQTSRSPCSSLFCCPSHHLQQAGGSYSQATESRVGLGKQPCSVPQKTAIEKEPLISDGTGSKHCVDTSGSPMLLQKEALLCHLHTQQKKWLLLGQGFRDCSKHTAQNKIKGPHSQKNFCVLSGRSGKTTFLDRAVVRPAKHSGGSVQMEHTDV